MSDAKPWRKLWREERGSFAQLPFYARGAFDEIMKLADDNGRIPLGGKTPVEVISLAMGVHVGERRMLRRHMAMLLADGCARIDGDTLVLTNFPRWQESPNPRAAAARTVHELGANRARTEIEYRPNILESLNTRSGEIEIERRERGERENARDLAGEESKIISIPQPAMPAGQAHRVCELWDQIVAEEHGLGVVGLSLAADDADTSRALRVARWAVKVVAHYQAKGETVDFDKVIRRSIEGFLRVGPHTPAGEYPFAFWAKSPHTWVNAERPKKAGSR